MMLNIIKKIYMAVGEILILPIRVYKKLISPLLGTNCRFLPSCSDYAMQAIRIHGPIKGLILGVWRILRCNPFCKPGLDPVPPKGKWKAAPKDENSLQ